MQISPSLVKHAATCECFVCDSEASGKTVLLTYTVQQLSGNGQVCLCIHETNRFNYNMDINHGKQNSQRDKQSFVDNSRIILLTY